MQVVSEGKVFNPESRYQTLYKTQTSTASYVSMGSTWIADLSKMTIHLRETGGSNAIKFKIDVSMDGSNWTNIKAETSLSASALHYETLTDVWRWLRVQIKDSVGGSHGDVELYIHAERM